MLCAVPSIFHPGVSEIRPGGSPQCQQRPDGCEHLPFRKPLRYESHPDFQPGEPENGGISGPQPEAGKGQVPADVRFRYFPAHGLYALCQLQSVPVLHRLQGVYSGYHVLRPDHYQRDSGGLLHVYFPVL